MNQHIFPGSVTRDSRHSKSKSLENCGRTLQGLPSYLSQQYLLQAHTVGSPFLFVEKVKGSPYLGKEKICLDCGEDHCQAESQTTVLREELSQFQKT